MNKLIILVAFLMSSAAFAEDLYELDRVEITYKSFKTGGHDPIIQDSGLQNRQADKELGLNLNMSFLSVIYFNNYIHGTSDTPIVGDGSGQFRVVGWQYEAGLRVTKFLDLGIGHHSQHLLDYAGPNHFPVENWVGIRVKLFESPREKGRIW